MSIFVKTDANPTTAPATMPYLENDYAIVRGVTLAMFDWSNEKTYSGTGVISGGSSFGNLASGGAAASIPQGSGSSFPALFQGTLKVQGQVSAGGYPLINLPTTFNFSPSVMKSLIALWAKFPSTGFSASAIVGLIGSGTGIGSSLQWHVYAQADASGNLNNITFRVRGSSANIDCVLSGATLAAFLDGNLHQLGFAFEIMNGVGKGYIYIDGVLKVTGSSGAMTSYNQPDGTPVFFSAPGVGTLSGTGLDARMGRISCHDLTNRSDLSFTDLLTKDSASAAGYVY